MGRKIPELIIIVNGKCPKYKGKYSFADSYTGVDSYTYGKETAVMYSAGTAHANLHSLNR